MLPDQLSAVLAAQYIFWVLLPFVLFAPVRWAVLAWLVMGNLDPTDPSTALSSVGWMNASKGIVLPFYLWWRLRTTGGESPRALPTELWLIFVSYATVASLWSPFPLGAAKLVGNLIGTLVSFVLLQKAARSSLFNRREIIVLILASIGLGALQTFYYGGAAYGFDGTDRPSRFSSFVGAQQYGAFLVAFLAIVLWYPSFRVGTRVWLSMAVSVALILNGSRTWFFGALVVLVVYLFLSFRKVVFSATLVAIGAAFGIALILNLSSKEIDILGDTSSRIVATLSAVLKGQDTSENTGLANLDFRLTIYRDVVQELKSSNPAELLFGHGTSSGGNIVMHVFPRSYKADRLDPNRAIHDEWLRAFYEWGIVGLGLLISVFVGLLKALWSYHSKRIEGVDALAALSFLPAFLLAFSTENLLASAGNAVTMSLALIVGLSWVPRRTDSKRASPGSVPRALPTEYVSAACT